MPRPFDAVLSLMALILLFPLLVMLAASVLISMGRPVFFVQSRLGRDGRPFDMVKFRSLDVRGAPTALGAFMRRFSLDELPGFWNVLRGEMALVGPRPLIASDQPRADRVRRERLSLLPGMTGWAQVNGRNTLSFERSYMYDIWYRRNRSPALDLYILLLTLPVVATGRGACGIAHAAERNLPRLRGAARQLAGEHVPAMPVPSR